MPNTAYRTESLSYSRRQEDDPSRPGTQLENQKQLGLHDNQIQKKKMVIVPLFQKLQTVCQDSEYTPASPPYQQLVVFHAMAAYYI